MQKTRAAVSVLISLVTTLKPGQGFLLSVLRAEASTGVKGYRSSNCQTVSLPLLVMLQAEVEMWEAYSFRKPQILLA